MGHSGPQSSKSFSVEDFHKHIVNKVNSIREATSIACPASLATLWAGLPPLFSEFSPPSTAEVIAVVKSSANKQCHFDPLPTWLLKESIGLLALFITTPSRLLWQFPVLWNYAIVSPKMSNLVLI